MGVSVKAVVKIIAIILAICTLGYLLPWAIAVCRGTNNTVSIFFVNLFFGWTLIIWIVCLIMALK
ncbi:superinfection immunity protein [Acetobacteraceae bacterium]|nr:superinfection immunity protein [Acetobacteraceae bacterium]